MTIMALRGPCVDQWICPRGQDEREEDRSEKGCEEHAGPSSRKRNKPNHEYSGSTKSKARRPVTPFLPFGRAMSWLTLSLRLDVSRIGITFRTCVRVLLCWNLHHHPTNN